MTRIISFVCVIVALFAAQARAADQAGKANSPKAEFKVSQELVVGTVTLKPGTYKFQCWMVGEAEFLIVTNDEGKEVARVPCKPSDLAAKTDYSDFRFTRRPDGTSALTGVRIRGEKVEHRVVTD